MIQHAQRRLNPNSRASRRRNRALRPWGHEGLEDRVLLAGGPTVYTVNLLSDAGTGTGNSGDIAYVITRVNANTDPAGSLIQFDPTVFATSQTIPLTNTLELSVTAGPVVIQGPATNNVVINGEGNVADFMIDTGVTAVLSHLVITNGNDGGDGGGISSDGTLTVADCVLTGNSTAHDGGGIANTHTLTVTDSVITGNTAAGNGGGISNTGTLTVHGTQITKNIGDNDAGGILSRMGTATVGGSLVAGNTAGSDGGGIANLGPSQLAISDSTLANNGALNGGGIENEATLKAVNVTIVYNQASAGGAGVQGFGGGLYNDGGTATLDNTIVALNTNIFTSPAKPDDIPLAVSSASAFNLIGNGGSGGLTNGTNGNQVGVANPALSTLGDHGGSSPTVALLPGSPAIDKGSDSLAVDPATGQALTTDQRGAGFARISNGTVDIGAFEFQLPAVTAVSVAWGSVSSPLQTASDGTRLLPAGRNNDLPWAGINQIRITLNQPGTLTAADVTIQGLGTNYGPVTVSGSGTSYTITLARPISSADRVTITIGGSDVTAFTRRLDVLPGDFNDDGVVNNKDITAVRNEFKGKGGAKPTIFGDVLGDGTVDANDFKAEKRFRGTRLPSTGKPVHKSRVRVLVRQHAESTSVLARPEVRHPAGPLVSLSRGTSRA
jgi:hypothetical protein